MSTQPNPFITPEEYLEIERKAEYKSEYFNGQMFAMSGASRRHVRLCSRLIALVEAHLEGSGCETYTADMRTHIPQNGLYTYPDLSVACTEPKFIEGPPDTLLNPILIVEVLSPSTETYDRGNKAKLYRDLPSLQELLLISQDRHDVDLYRRSATGWTLLNASGPDASIELTSIGFTLHLSRLYADILPQSAAHS